jgi:formylglycine-generating enzyme required for sulfatase activity
MDRMTGWVCLSALGLCLYHPLRGYPGAAAEKPSPDGSSSPAPAGAPALPDLQKLTDLGLVTLDGIPFVKIPAGVFRMGTPLDQRQAMQAARQWSPLLEVEQPAHLVTITRPFLLGKCELTQAQWVRVMKGKMPRAEGSRRPAKDNPSTFPGEDLPVETVSWDEAKLFVKSLNEGAAGKYRLPTEAEWEYACRAGGDGPFGRGGERKPITVEYLPEYAWYAGNAENRTHPVGMKKPNAWGLHDMLGNVWEWCQDSFSPDYYRHSPARDPLDVADSTERVFRGGCWFLDLHPLRCAARGGNLPSFKSPYVGLRLARDL